MHLELERSHLTQRLYRELRATQEHLSAEPTEDLDRSVSSAITLIDQTFSIVEQAQETIRIYEETIYDQNKTIAQINNDREDVFNKLIQLEKLYSRETDRGSKAAAQSAALSERVKLLEQRNSNLLVQLERMIQAVSRSISEKGIAPRDKIDHPLRAVA